MSGHDPSEILTALVDGEAVHPEELAAALARPGAADMLVDFASLRHALRESEAGSRPEEESGPLGPPVGRVRGSVRRLAALAAAAALVVTTAAVTRWLGSSEPIPVPSIVEGGSRPLAIPSERLKIVPSGSRHTEAKGQQEEEQWL